MVNKLICGMFFFAIGSIAMIGGLRSQEPTQKDASKFMAQKLDRSRDIVAGLATENYDLMSKSAQDLMLISHEADWNVIQSQQYLRMSNDFRGSAERLRDTANEKNLDGATIAYFEVTLSCVRCHKYVRNHHQADKK